MQYETMWQYFEPVLLIGMVRIRRVVVMVMVMKMEMVVIVVINIIVRHIDDLSTVTELDCPLKQVADWPTSRYDDGHSLLIGCMSERRNPAWTRCGQWCFEFRPFGAPFVKVIVKVFGVLGIFEHVEDVWFPQPEQDLGSGDRLVWRWHQLDGGEWVEESRFGEGQHKHRGVLVVPSQIRTRSLRNTNDISVAMAIRCVSWTNEE